MLQVICRPEATNKEEAYTFHTVHSKLLQNEQSKMSAVFTLSCRYVFWLFCNEVLLIQSVPDQFVLGWSYNIMIF